MEFIITTFPFLALPTDLQLHCTSWIHLSSLGTWASTFSGARKYANSELQWELRYINEFWDHELFGKEKSQPPSPGQPNCTWKELYQQARWFVTKLPLPRVGWNSRRNALWMEDLQDCCMGGNWLAVRRLRVAHEYQTYDKDPVSWSIGYHPLVLAAKDSVDCLRILLSEFHPDLQWRDAGGRTVLHHAIWNDNTAAIDCVHNEFGVSLDSITDEGWTALHFAVGNIRLAATRWVVLRLEGGLTLPGRRLLQLGADHTIMGPNGQTPLGIVKCGISRAQSKGIKLIDQAIQDMMEKEFNITS